MTLMIHWLRHLTHENVDMLGADGRPQGMANDRPAIETFVRYHHEQGLSK